MIQLSFKSKHGEYSDDFVEEAKYQTALAASGWLHRFTAWIWTGDSLKTKDAQGEDTDCHFTLFGEIIYRCPFRGWFNPEKKVCAFMSNRGEASIAGPDMIPERVYQHLVRKFGRDISFICP